MKTNDARRAKYQKDYQGIPRHEIIDELCNLRFHQEYHDIGLLNVRKECELEYAQKGIPDAIETLRLLISDYSMSRYMAWLMGGSANAKTAECISHVITVLEERAER